MHKSKYPKLKHLALTEITFTQGELERFFDSLGTTKLRRIRIHRVGVISDSDNNNTKEGGGREGSWARPLDILREKVMASISSSTSFSFFSSSSSSSSSEDDKCTVHFSSLCGGGFELVKSKKVVGGEEDDDMRWDVRGPSSPYDETCKELLEAAARYVLGEEEVVVNPLVEPELEMEMEMEMEML